MSNVYISIDNSELMIRAAYSQVQAALKAVALSAEKYAKHDCPVDTGRLRSSITHAVDADTAYIGTNVEYATYVEMGTKYMDARPFLKPAIENHIDEYKQMVEEILK